MGYELLGRAHAAVASQRGQGTVEYVGLILLLAVVMAAVVAAAHGMSADSGIPKAILEKLKGAIGSVTDPGA
jgi:hypothetical protein